MYMRDRAPTETKPCHDLINDHGELECENCAAMPLKYCNQRAAKYCQIAGESGEATRPDTLPQYGWSLLHINAAIVVDIHGHLKHLKISVPTTVEGAEIAAFTLSTLSWSSVENAELNAKLVKCRECRIRR